MTNHSKPLEIARVFTDAWTSHDLPLAASFVADDVVFDGPLQQSVGAKPYIDGLTKLSETITGIQMIAALGDEETALIMYDLHTKSHGTLSCAKCLTIHNGKIQRDKLVFDSHKLRQA